MKPGKALLLGHQLGPGCVLELGKHFRVGGAEILNYKSDLPIKCLGPDMENVENGQNEDFKNEDSKIVNSKARSKKLHYLPNIMCLSWEFLV